MEKGKTLLLSIKPVFAHKILNGEKKFEYRKKRAIMPVGRAVIYSTLPEQMILGEATIRSVLEDEKEKLWKKTKEYAGLKKEEFDKYFCGCERAVAYHLDDVVVYDEEIRLSDLHIFRSPQSYQYLEDGLIDRVVKEKRSSLENC